MTKLIIVIVIISVACMLVWNMIPRLTQLACAFDQEIDVAVQYVASQCLFVC